MKLSGIAKFLSHYAGELLAITGTVRTITSALPLGRDDKAKIDAALAELEKGASNVAKSAPAFNENKVTIKRSDVEAAVAKVLPGIVAAELKRLGIEAAKEGEGNGNG